MFDMAGLSIQWRILTFWHEHLQQIYHGKCVKRNYSAIIKGSPFMMGFHSFFVAIPRFRTSMAYGYGVKIPVCRNVP